MDLFRCCSLLLILLSVPALSQNRQRDVVKEIQRALRGRQDLSFVVEYLKLSHDDLSAVLSDRGSATYTFLAPVNWAFIRLLPQDTFDVFTVDSEFRREVLLRHFIRRRLTDTDLRRPRTDVVMADGSRFTLQRTNNMTRIGEAAIDPRPILLPSGLGVVYVVDGAFTTHQAVYDVLKKHPANQSPWGSLTGDNGVAQESATVVVDLVAEYLNGKK